MGLNNFRINVVFRILLLAAAIGGFLFCFHRAGLVVTPVILFVVIIASITELVFYVERTNREFTNFLLSVKSSDFSKYGKEDTRGKSFAGFRKALNLITEEFQLARIGKEANYQFMQAVVEHMDTAIISFDKAGEVKLINETAKTLLHMPYLKNIYSLQKTDPELCSYLLGLQNGNKTILDISIGGEKLKLSFRSATFIMQGTEHTLISVQNIKTEIEHTELEAWEQLLHVLTHEIMNSITPLSSLSATLKTKAIHLMDTRTFDEEAIDDLSQGLSVIERRSIGLVNFVNHYRSLITLPEPEFRVAKVSELFENIKLLKGDVLQRKGISLKMDVKNTSMTVRADTALIEQVLINLINNAIDAVAGCANPAIELSATVVNNRVIISVADNGPGIESDVLDKIFIPFFTTKNSGSGIGLSLSKQIMRLHQGSIKVNAALSHGTVFTLEFPA
jgi:signal transduction histidine kinase